MQKIVVALLAAVVLSLTVFATASADRRHADNPQGSSQLVGPTTAETDCSSTPTVGTVTVSVTDPSIPFSEVDNTWTLSIAIDANVAAPAENSSNPYGLYNVRVEWSSSPTAPSGTCGSDSAHGWAVDDGPVRADQDGHIHTTSVVTMPAGSYSTASQFCGTECIGPSDAFTVTLVPYWETSLEPGMPNQPINPPCPDPEWPSACNGSYVTPWFTLSGTHDGSDFRHHHRSRADQSG